MNDINEAVYGHAQAKKVLAVLVKRSKDRYYKKCVLGIEDVPASLKCLLIGQSGTGKTHLIDSLSKIHKFPLIRIDATQLMPTGNTDGLNVKQLKKLIKDKVDLELAQSKDRHDGRYHSAEGVMNQLVVFVDEFDKLGTSFDSSGNWNKHVQANFLTMIDNKEEFEGISWVFAGAFSGLYAKEHIKRGIGFSSSLSSEKETTAISDQDIIKAGVIPEMVGRISLIVQLDDFTEADYKTVLSERLLKNYTELTLSDEQMNDIVKKAYDSGQGIRSLTRQLEMLSIDAEFEELNLGVSL
jgi:ATP-dependent Clp protease ATP-binding subunit ClpX